MKESLQKPQKMKIVLSTLLATILIQGTASACRRSLSDTAPVDKAVLKAKLNDFLSIAQNKKESRTLAASCPTFLKNLKKNTYPFECGADIGSFYCVIYDYFCIGETELDCPIIGGFLGTASASPDGFAPVTWLNGAVIFPAEGYLIYNPVSAPLITIEGETVPNDVPFTSAKTNPLGNNACGVDKLKSVTMEITEDCGIYGTLKFN